MSNIISTSITLEVVGTTITDAYFNQDKEYIIDTVTIFKSELGEHSVTKTINISKEDSWGYTREEFMHVVSTFTKEKQRPPKPEPLKPRTIVDGAAPKGYLDDRPPEFETVKVKDITNF